MHYSSNMFKKCHILPSIFVFFCVMLFFLNKDAYLLIPPILAIGLAFITRNVLFSLFMGMLSGALISVGSWSISGAFRAFLRVADHYMVGALSDSNHAGLILFTMTIGGMIAMLTQSGGLTKLL